MLGYQYIKTLAYQGIFSIFNNYNFYSKLRASLQVTSQSVQTWNALHCCLHHIKDWNHQLMLALFFPLYAIMISIYLLFMTDLQEHVSDTDSTWPWTLSLTFKVTNIHVPLDFVSFVLSLLIINGFSSWVEQQWLILGPSCWYDISFILTHNNPHVSKYIWVSDNKNYLFNSWGTANNKFVWCKVLYQEEPLGITWN